MSFKVLKISLFEIKFAYINIRNYLQKLFFKRYMVETRQEHERRETFFGFDKRRQALRRQTNLSISVVDMQAFSASCVAGSHAGPTTVALISSPRV